ncbi:MAG: adenylate/guanylate cyclase domain-containing protein [Candidatus Tectomicrobia bacterium]|uniref:Adenylate/guanylate cyclase domain-containing protein n=1 Tax=Tectimicrobiota bacterium TaxID=2528274 RepID=A0A933GMX1_UNCTE|nr:adenylate/guanylate cyclase domain-containing protein [Candidatus Tectomicrobia bacterium]
MFADVRGFTSLSERMSPTLLRETLNILFAAASELLIQNDALIDKFLGDAIMALFNAPIPQARHREMALQTAIALLGKIANLNLPFEIGIGLNSGPAITGNVGGGEVTDYTAIGDTVNVASRLSGLAGKSEILAGLDTYGGQSHWLPSGYECDRVSLQVKGKEQLVNAYRIFRPKTLESTS